MLIRNLIRDGRMEHLAVVTLYDDGSICVAPFDGETERTIFIDDTLAIISQQLADCNPQLLNSLDYDNLIRHFIELSAITNAPNKHIIVLNPGNVKIFTP
ncbi:MAG: hypothetical protein ACI30S_00345 [Muribaculaceae bacterium]